jgi:hypothetical protein
MGNAQLPFRLPDAQKKNKDKLQSTPIPPSFGRKKKKFKTGVAAAKFPIGEYVFFVLQRYNTFIFKFLSNTKCSLFIT